MGKVHKFYLSRLFRNEHETIGILSTAGRIICHSLEDEKRTVKVFGKTRIPAGIYNIKLRTKGSHHQRYKKNYPSWNKGMLHIINVPDFKYILIHIGNDDEDTAGCILPATDSSIGQDNRYTLKQSTVAYMRLYPLMAEPLARGDIVLLEVRDEPTGDIYDWVA